jgi:hypothetical protein
MDNTVFSFDPSTRDFGVWTADNSKATTYTYYETAIQGGAAAPAISIGIPVTIISCTTNSFPTKPNVAVAYPTYTVGSPLVTINFTAWTSSIAHCGPITYTAVNETSGSPVALDTGLITFDNTTLTFSVNTMNDMYVGIHTIRVNGTTVSPGGV